MYLNPHIDDAVKVIEQTLQQEALVGKAPSATSIALALNNAGLLNIPAKPIAPVKTSEQVAYEQATMGVEYAFRYGTTFTYGKHTYNVIGYKKANWKYPFIVRRQPDGKRFRVSHSHITKGLVKS